MKRFIALATLLLVTGCAREAQSPIATVDLQRIKASWPKFINYTNQLSADAAAIERSGASERTKAQQRDGLRARAAKLQDEVAGDVLTAAQQVANDRHFSLVVTREYVGYGGTDITPDIERILKITEVAPTTAP